MSDSKEVDFPTRLAALMREYGYSQREVARLAGVAPGTVAWWLKGSVPQRRILELLAQRLNISSEWLEHGQGERMPKIPHPVGFPSHQKSLKKTNTLQAEYLPVIQAYKGMASELRLMADRCDQKATQATREMTSRMEKIGRDYVVKAVRALGGRVKKL